MNEIEKANQLKQLIGDAPSVNDHANFWRWCSRRDIFVHTIRLAAAGDPASINLIALKTARRDRDRKHKLARAMRRAAAEHMRTAWDLRSQAYRIAYEANKSDPAIAAIVKFFEAHPNGSNQ